MCFTVEQYNATMIQIKQFWHTFIRTTWYIHVFYAVVRAEIVSLKKSDKNNVIKTMMSIMRRYRMWVLWCGGYKS